MPRRVIAFCVLALVAAALFIRLGIWQLERLRDRRARNMQIAAQHRAAPVDVRDVGSYSTALQYRAVRLNGRYDYDHELVLASRTHEGSPGVELLTPVRQAGTDTVIVVNRGWVYSPDGGTIDRARWREGDSATVVGYIEVFSPTSPSRAVSRDPHIVRRASREEISSRLPYPIAPFYVVARGDTAGRAHPARRNEPVIDDGPHRSYAVQWFCFAAIALGGAAAVVWRERREGRVG